MIELMSATPSPLPDALVELIAQRFRLLGEPTRIKLLDAGMIRRTKEGNRAYFSIADESLFALCDQVCGSLRRQIAEIDALLQTEGEPAR